MKKNTDHWLFGNKNSSIVVKILRWTARIWSLFALALALIIVFSPDPYATEAVPFKDYFILSLWGVAILGLVIAWRWERIGAWMAIITLAIREVLYVIINHEWSISFLLVWALVVPPAVMFLLAWTLDHQKSA